MRRYIPVFVLLAASTVPAQAEEPCDAPARWVRLELGAQAASFHYTTWDGNFEGLSADQTTTSVVPQVTLGVLFETEVPFWSLGANIGVSRPETYLDSVTGTRNVDVGGSTVGFDRTVEGDLNLDLVTVELTSLFHFDVGDFRAGAIAGPGLMLAQSELWQREIVSGPTSSSDVETTTHSLGAYPFLRLGIEPSYLIGDLVRVGVVGSVRLTLSEPDLVYSRSDVWHQEPDTGGGTVIVSDSEGATQLELQHPMVQAGLVVSVGF